MYLNAFPAVCVSRESQQALTVRCLVQYGLLAVEASVGCDWQKEKQRRQTKRCYELNLHHKDSVRLSRAMKGKIEHVCLEHFCCVSKYEFMAGK